MNGIECGNWELAALELRSVSGRVLGVIGLAGVEFLAVCACVCVRVREKERDCFICVSL